MPPVIVLQQLVSGLVQQMAANKEGFRLNELSMQQESTGVDGSMTLDDVERKLQLAASIIRGHRNSRQAINRLPPELLSTIFLETRATMPDFLPVAKRGIYEGEDRHWFSLLHVCRHWRGIVATCPLLWTVIDGGVDPQLFLRKSNPAPVDVYLGYRGPKSIAFGMPVIKALKPHMSRIRRLGVNLSAWRGDKPLLSVLNRPAPNLISLALCAESGDVSWPTNIPPIFNGVMPSLRQLALDHFTSWPPNYFTGLTHLCLSYQSEIGRPTTVDFLDFLESSPLLEELILANAGPTREADDDLPPPAYDRRVALDRLREVNFGDWPSLALVSRLLSHLILPATADIFIWGKDILAAEETIATFLPSDLSNLPSVRNLKELWIERFPDEWWHERQLIIIVRGTLYVWGPYTHYALESIMSSFDLGQVSTVRLRDCCYFPNRLSGNFWSNLFDHLPSLQHLSICSILSDSIFLRAALSAFDPTHHEVNSPKTSSLSDENANNTIVCPMLETLSIESFLIPTLFLDTITEHRARHGHPLSKLEILCLDPLGNGGGAGNGNDLLNGEPNETDGELGDFAQRDLGLLRRHVKEASIDFSFSSPTVFKPPMWPNAAYNWVHLPLSIDH